MTKLQKAIVVRVVLFAAVTLTGCLSVVRIDLTGVWTGSFVWTNGPSPGIESPISLDLVHEGRDVSGTVILMGPGSQPFELTIGSGRTSIRSILIEASGTLSLPAAGTSIVVALELDGDFDTTTMSGTGTQTFDGNTYSFTWEILRASGPPEA